MDKGAHFYRCDFQVHTPRDLRWAGPNATSDEERLAYGHKLVAACRERGIQAIAITDHHCMTFVPFIRQAAAEETSADGSALHDEERLVVFPGMELTLGVPCQAIVIFDADFPNDFLPNVLTAFTINQNGPEQSKIVEVQRLDHIQSLKGLKDELDKHSFLRDRYTIFPNVSGEGQFSLLRTGMAGKYSEMPWVGGYTDGEFAKLKDGPRNILSGKDKAWGNKRVACIQTSDTRREDHSTLGVPSTWIKWAKPSAEALRQACLAQESRIALDAPRVPETFIASLSVSNSSFLGPVDLALNPQYSALIGGRGTGKSTVLEYLRWALCDQPPLDDLDEAPNYQARRSRLIDKTLRPLGATVQVTYVLNGVPHLIRRASVDGSVQMKIGAGELRPCTEGEVRALLPIQAYSQKQLSDVSVRVDELTRFITAPIKGDLDRLERKATDLANRIKESYATRQRFRELSKVLGNRILEEQSITEQANVLRESLSGLSEDDRRLLEQGKDYASANSQVSGWRAGAGTVRQKADELKQIVERQLASLPSAPDKPAAEKEVLERARAAYAGLLQNALTALDGLSMAAQSLSDTNPESAPDDPWIEWDSRSQAFQARYNAAVQRSSSHSEKLQQLSALETRVRELSDEATRTRELLATLSSADANYIAARNEWLAAQAEQDSLIERECAALTTRSGGAIRVGVKRHADSTAFVETLRQGLSGSRVQGNKIEAVGDAITKAANPSATWLQILDDLETLADYESGHAPTEVRPQAAALVAAGLSANDLDRTAQTLQPETWLSLSLTPIASIPVYEFRAREGEYIPFENASAGQQATALLKTLLNQPGPPLIIDQPEEDLDNPVMLEIVEQLWEAKRLRQIVFASHNANLVVNGDAELVAWFGYRASGDESRGTIKGEGAIDIPDARDAIKRIMEGGESAFRLRREKYGF
jgi:hypothetical protein